MLSAAALTLALSASAAVAAPTYGSGLKGRLARRAAARHTSAPLSAHPGSPLANGTTNGAVHESYSTNWAGAVYNSGSFTGVSGTFTVPTPQVPGGGSSSSYSSSAWVGIDGSSCSNAILQTGVDFTVDSSGNPSYDAWYEWFPAGADDFSGISFNAGDVVSVSVTATSTTAGSAVIENTTSGQKVSQDLTSSSALCETNAEWIVEDFEENGGLVPFSNFGTVTFTGASATTGSGSVGPASATIIDIQQSGTVLTSSSADASSVTVKYVGP